MEMASLSRIADAEHEDGEDRNPLAGLFPAELWSLDQVIDKIRLQVSQAIDVAVKKARRKARELEEEFPNLTEDERAMITLYTMELNPKEGSTSKASLVMRTE